MAIDEEIVDYIWIMFNNLYDNDSEELINAVYYMHEKFNLDLDVLPQKLYDAVILKLAEDAKEAKAQDDADELL